MHVVFIDLKVITGLTIASPSPPPIPPPPPKVHIHTYIDIHRYLFIHRRFIVQRGTRAHTRRELIRAWLWEPKGISLEYLEVLGGRVDAATLWPPYAPARCRYSFIYVYLCGMSFLLIQRCHRIDHNVAVAAVAAAPEGA